MNKKSGTLLIFLGLLGAIAFFAVNFITTDMAEEPQETIAAITKETAAQHAKTFLETQYSLPFSYSFVTYQSHTELSGYLQKEKLNQVFAKKAGQNFPIDYYQVELTDENSDLHFLVNVNMTSGEVIGWKQFVKQPQLTDRQDIHIAESWLKTMGYAPNEFNLKSDFTGNEEVWIYENPGQKIGEAHFQIRLQILNGLVTSFQPTYELPHNFTRWMEQQQNYASWLSLLSLLLTFGLAIAAIVFTVLHRQTISFRRGILLSLVFVIIYCVNNLNMYPGLKTAAGADGGGEGLFSVIFAQFTIFLMAVSVYLSLISGDAMWRKKGRNLWAAWSDPLFGNELIKSMGRGYLLCLFILGVQSVLFYFGGLYFEVWSTVDPSNSVYNMFWPFLFPALAWAAAISEEAVYRMFGIIIFKRLLRNSFLAVLIPSIFWALGHVAYPIYPFYTRLIEVTVLGLIFGIAFLKYGFLTALFAHASMDSILMGISLMYSGGGANMIYGLMYIASPAIAAWLLSEAHGRFKKDRARKVIPVMRP